MVYTCYVPALIAKGITEELDANGLAVGLPAQAKITFEQRTPILGDIINYTDARGAITQYKVISISFNIDKDLEASKTPSAYSYFYHSTTIIGVEKIV